MTRARSWVSFAAAVALLGVPGCAPPGKEDRPASSTLIIGLDVSGSFRDIRQYDDAVEFAALYIYAHLRGLDELRIPTALFVGSLGGVRPGEAKAFHPINDFQNRTIEQIAADLRTWFPPNDVYTDFNTFFDRVATLVKERGLVLAPLNVVVLSDGEPDSPDIRRVRGQPPYAQINLTPLEYLSRSVTVRLLYASPTVGENWKRLIERRRVRMWTQEAQIMAGWHQQFKAGVPLEQQHDLWQWVKDNVDYRAQARLF